MIKYTATDIIKRAEQLADLENSDFVSDSEKLALLNEAFTVLYQKVINTNDRTWIQEESAENGMTLPDDFYMLSALYVKNTREEIQRRNSSELAGYEIKNNILYLSSEYQNSEIVMEYYPLPPSIFLKEKTVPSPYSENPLTATGKIFAYFDDTLKIASLESEIVIDTEIDTEPSSVALFSNAAIIDSNYFVYSTKTSTAFGDYIPCIIENRLYKLDKTTGKVYTLGGSEVETLEVTVDSDDTVIFKSASRVYQLGTNFFICNDGDKITIPAHKTKAEFSNLDLYIVSDTGKVLQLTEEEAVEGTPENSPVDVINASYVLTVKEFDNLYYLEGIMDDTLLDYPNNLFWVMLSYMLAMSFKTKQGADVTQLTALYNQAEAQFLASADKDANESYRMKNVYNTRRWW